MPRNTLAAVELDSHPATRSISYVKRPLRAGRALAPLETENMSQARRGAKAAIADQTDSLGVPALAFGPFLVFPNQRLLLEGDRPLDLGSRALDLLVAFIERPGELLSKYELMARIWPGTFVGEGNLKVQVAALRRALRDGKEGNRYISTVPGRGYWFVAPVHNLLA
jgi:DNA-binding winged helix-turn-helix (wHTH) protein